MSKKKTAATVKGVCRSRSPSPFTRAFRKKERKQERWWAAMWPEIRDVVLLGSNEAQSRDTTHRIASKEFPPC